MAPDALTNKELSAVKGEGHTIAEQAPRLSSSAAMADQQPVTPTPAERQVSQSVYRPAEVQARRLSISAEINAPQPVAQTPVELPAERRSPPDQATSPFRVLASEDEIKGTGQESGGSYHRSEVAGIISERTLVKPLIERVETEKSLVTQLQPHPVVPLHSRLERAWGKENETMQTEKLTPTIHVTIGRIEVRATTAPIQNQPKPKAQDAMSLDDYLARRNGGRR
jgi:hypothetical protein